MLLDPYHHVIPAFCVIILELVFRLLGIDQLNVTFSLQILEPGHQSTLSFDKAQTGH